MFVFNGEKRDTSLKAKQLRRKGIIPGVLYGKNLKESLSLQFSQGEAARFLKANATGSRVELVIGSDKFPALFREVTYQLTSDEPEHLSFQALVAEEVIASAARIVFINKEKDTGIIQQQLSEISYRALPAHLIEQIEINLEGMEIGDNMRVSDLDIINNPDIEVLHPLDDIVFSIADARKPMEIPESDEDVSETESETESEAESESE